MKNKSIKIENQNEHHEELDQSSPRSSVKKQVFATLGILTCLLIATVFVVLYARGYRLFVKKGTPAVSKTGILHITSAPTSAQVSIDGHLTTASNNTINLTPKKYSVRISKDGYNDWQKDVDIKEEVVTSIDALLFPKSPSLQSISTFGVEEALIDPTGNKIAFKISSQSAVKRNGIYIFDMTSRALPILQGPGSSTQLADDGADRFSSSKISFSPDGKQLLASISALPDPATPDVNPDISTYYLLKTDGFNDIPQDITATSANQFELWQNQRAEKEKAKLKSLKPKVADFYKKYFRVLSWSPDERKILYQASDSAQMPVFLNPRRIGNNLLYERRDLKKDAIYVYDTTEDINTRIIDSLHQICNDNQPECTYKNPFSWLPDSAHLVYVHDKKIELVEDDGANMTTIYAGPFLGHYVFPWPDGSKLVILTSLGNSTVSPTLYTIGLK